MSRWKTCCCGGPDTRESKLLAVAAPFLIFYEPFTGASSSDLRYLVRTEVWNNSTGTRTTTSTWDEFCGSFDTGTVDDPGYDHGVSPGTLLSHTVSATVETFTYTAGFHTITLSDSLTWQGQADVAQSELDSRRGTNDMKPPFGVTGWFDLGSGLEEIDVACLFPSENSDFATLVPGSSFGASRILLIPDQTDFPWNGKYVITLPTYGTDWYYASYGWPGSQINAPSNLNFLGYLSGSGDNPGDWKAGNGYLLSSQSCHALPVGIGCATGGPLDLVEETLNQSSDAISSGSCLSIDLPSGWWCFGPGGIFPPGSSTPHADSWSAQTVAGWQAADEVGNGNGLIFLAASFGPIPWLVDCCP